jgi:flagellar biosynthesis/type III secretory pathway protein FliH
LSEVLAIRRYAFETVFDADGAILSEGVTAPMYSAADLEREHEAGFEAGRRSESARAEAEAAAALADIAQSVARMSERTTADRRAMAEDAARLAIVVARKVAGLALARFGEDRVVAAIDAAFETFVHAPRLVVRVGESMEGVRARLDEVAGDHGFSGTLVVRAEPGLQQGDVSIDWGEGAMSLGSEDAFRRIEEIVAAALSVEQPA